jgi:hypothetical protein
MNDKPQTLQQAIVYFADKEIAHQYVVNARWADGVECPYCKGKEHSYITTRNPAERRGNPSKQAPADPNVL